MGWGGRGQKTRPYHTGQGGGRGGGGVVGRCESENGRILPAGLAGHAAPAA